jgi:hypothetical protein
MASIYTIKGTDSISSSRLNINDNFENIADDLDLLNAVFSFPNEDLDIDGTLAVGGAATITGNATVAGALTVTGLSTVVDLVVNGKIKKQASPTTIATLTGTLDENTYLLDATGGVTGAALANGEEGQEILFIATGTAGDTFQIVPTTSNIYGGVATITLESDEIGANVTLRFSNSKWHIVSAGGAGCVVA